MANTVLECSGHLLDIAGSLERAADVIEKRGWCQQSLSTPQGAVCAQGALHVAFLGQPQVSFLDMVSGRTYVLDLSGLFIHHMLWTEGSPPELAATTAWNDQPAQTKDEVVTSLRKWAKKARAMVWQEAGVRSGVPA